MKSGLLCALCIVLGFTGVFGSVDASLPKTFLLNLLCFCRVHVPSSRRMSYPNPHAPNSCVLDISWHLPMNLHHGLALAAASSLPSLTWVPPPDPFPKPCPIPTGLLHPWCTPVQMRAHLKCFDFRYGPFSLFSQSHSKDVFRRNMGQLLG